MRPQDDRSQQSILGLCDQDSGIVAENVQVVSCQKHWRSPTTLERRIEDVPRWLLLPLHEARIRVDRGFVGCGEHTEISCMTPEICVARTKIFAQHSPEALH